MTRPLPPDQLDRYKERANELRAEAIQHLLRMAVTAETEKWIQLPAVPEAGSGF